MDLFVPNATAATKAKIPMFIVAKTAAMLIQSQWAPF
jgi:hypothetical protein